MKLRDLKKKDAELMLEWMHDDDVISGLQANFKEKKLEDCICFIELSEKKEENLNLAIVDDDDIYMGTVSLKHIDLERKCAEFAITVRSCAMGKGYSKSAMREIISIGHHKYGLENIYWCVSIDNKRAVRFYDKNDYERVENVPDSIKGYYTKDQINNFYWYRA